MAGRELNFCFLDCKWLSKRIRAHFMKNSVGRQWMVIMQQSSALHSHRKTSYKNKAWNAPGWRVASHLEESALCGIKGNTFNALCCALLWVRCIFFITLFMRAGTPQTRRCQGKMVVVIHAEALDQQGQRAMGIPLWLTLLFVNRAVVWEQLLMMPWHSHGDSVELSKELFLKSCKIASVSPISLPYPSPCLEGCRKEHLGELLVDYQWGDIEPLRDTHEKWAWEMPTIAILVSLKASKSAYFVLAWTIQP